MVAGLRGLVGRVVAVGPQRTAVAHLPRGVSVLERKARPLLPGAQIPCHGRARRGDGDRATNEAALLDAGAAGLTSKSTGSELIRHF